MFASGVPGTVCDRFRIDREHLVDRGENGILDSGVVLCG
jgi:hypothetical protein